MQQQMQLYQMQMMEQNYMTQKQKMIIPKDKIEYSPSDKKEFKLLKEDELRIETQDTIKITLLKGTAEIEGLTLPLEQEIYFQNRKFAIFCWEDSTIEVCGKPDICYIGKETPMISYLMSFYLINDKRSKALDTNTIGPKVLILGSKNSGKRTLTHTFLNYSLKHGYKAIYVDLSLNNEISMPGCISATVIDEPLPNNYLIENSLSLFNGNLNISVSNNQQIDDLYINQVKELAKCTNQKLEADLENFKASNSNSKGDNKIISSEPQLFASGSIIYCDSFDGFQVYKKIIEYFACNIIFIIDNDRLFSSISSEFVEQIKREEISVIKLQKSSGVLNVNDKTNKNNMRMNSYFRGPLNNVSMKGFELPIKSIKLFQIVNSQVDRNLVTIGKSIDLKLVVKEVHISEDNINTLMKRIISINNIPRKIIDEIGKSTDYNRHLEELCQSTVEYFGYM